MRSPSIKTAEWAHRGEGGVPNTFGFVLQRKQFPHKGQIFLNIYVFIVLQHTLIISRIKQENFTFNHQDAKPSPTHILLRNKFLWPQKKCVTLQIKTLQISECKIRRHAKTLDPSASLLHNLWTINLPSVCHRVQNVHIILCTVVFMPTKYNLSSPGKIE